MIKRIRDFSVALFMIMLCTYVFAVEAKAANIYGEKPVILQLEDIDYKDLSKRTGYSEETCKYLVTHMVAVIKGEETSLDVSNLPDVTQSNFFGGNDDIFFDAAERVVPYLLAASSYGVSYSTYGGKLYTLWLYDREGLGDEQRLARANEIETAVNEIFSKMPKGMGEADKALWLNDYMVLNYEYDYDRYLSDTLPNDSFQIYGMLVNKMGVCDAYSKTYKLLLNLCGVDAIRVTGTGNGGSHAWNQVKIDGNWYSCDVTWDDPVPDEKGRTIYTYMFMTDAQIGTNHKLESKGMGCTDTKFYNWFGRTGVNRFTYYDGEWYYTLDGKCYKSDIYGNNKELVYDGSGAALCSNGYLIYNKSGWDIYALELGTGTEVKLFTVESEGIECYDTALLGWTGRYASISSLSIIDSKIIVKVTDPYVVSTESNGAVHIGFNTVIKSYALNTKYYDPTTDSYHKNHKVVVDKAIAATCTTDGKTEGSHCIVCDAVLVAQNTITKLDHSYGAGVVTKKETCTGAGVKTYTCTRCNSTKKTTIKATGHTVVVDKAVAPTCTRAGKTEGSHCETCSTVFEEQKTIAKLGHSYDSGVITKNATCTEDGTTTYTCTICKQTKTEAIAAAHKAVVDKAVAATCTKAGKTEGSHCSVCNTEIKAQEKVVKLGHSYGAAVVTKKATCTEAGEKKATCTRCNYVKTTTVNATGHKAVVDKAVAATCTKAGKTEGSHCSACNVVIKAQTTVAKLGHSYDSGKVTKAATFEEAGVKTYTCTRCKATKTSTIAKLVLKSQVAGLTGLGLGTDNNWYYFDNGSVNKNYTGLAYSDSVGWWYVEKGAINFGKTGLVYDESLGWWYVEGGTINFSKTGLVCDATLGWWAVENGAISFKTGLVYDENVGWWYVEGGTINFSRTGLVCDATLGWWAVENGAINFNANGLVFDEYVGWWYVEGGAINFGYTGAVYCFGTWWNVVNGQLA